MRNIVLRIEYDGADFVGSQWQTNGRSVQGELERAWTQLTQEQRRITLSGRTDSGVHARGQVANVRSETTRPLHVILRGLNALLPSDVAVLDVWEAEEDFHARFSAIRRDYRYLIESGPVATPLLRRNVVHVAGPLDQAAMQVGLEYLEGTHDFAAFTVAAFTGSTVRTCFLARCLRVEVLGQELLAIDVAANAFLQHMVRNIVGTALEIGLGRLQPSAIPAILASRDRRKAGRTAPAHGLYLMSVAYPSDGQRPSLEARTGGRSE